MKQLDTHFVPLSQVTSGKPSSGESPGDLAALLEWQMGRATHPDQKITVTMDLGGAASLARLLRQARAVGL
jgi:hypothetical protein